MPKTLTLTALALATFFTTLTPATATDTPATNQTIEQLTQTRASVTEETNRLIVTLKDDTTNKDVLAHDASALTDTLDDATLVKDQVAGDTSTIVLETDTLLNEQEQNQTIAQLEADPRIESVTPDRLVLTLVAPLEVLSREIGGCPLSRWSTPPALQLYIRKRDSYYFPKLLDIKRGAPGHRQFFRATRRVSHQRPGRDWPVQWLLPAQHQADRLNISGGSGQRLLQS